MCVLQGEGEQDLPMMSPEGALGAELLQPGGVRKKLKLEQAHGWENTPQKNVLWSWGRDGKGLLGRLRKPVRNTQVTRPFALASWPSPELPSNLLHVPLCPVPSPLLLWYPAWLDRASIAPAFRKPTHSTPIKLGLCLVHICHLLTAMG